MAAVVNRLVDLGAKVIVANLPDLGLSPVARAEATATTSRTDCVTPPPAAGPLTYSASTSWPTCSACSRLAHRTARRARTS